MKLELKLTPKLTLIFVLFAFALLLTIGVLAYRSGQQALIEATVSELTATAVEKEAALDEWIEVRQWDLSVLAVSPRLHQALVELRNVAESAPGSLETLRQEMALWVGPEGFQTLLVLDPETGQVLAATDSSEEGRYKENRPYFIHGLDGPYVQNPYYSLTLRGAAMTIATPIRSETGQPLGVLVGRLNLDLLDEIIQRSPGIHETADTFLVNKSNLIVTQPRFIRDAVVLQQGLRTAVIDRCLAGHSGVSIENDYRGVLAVIVYHWLPDHGLCLKTKIDEAEALAAPHAFGSTLLFLGSLALLAASAIAILLSHSITYPVRTLQAGVSSFGQGQHVQLPEKRGDELGVLAREFNQMAATIAEKEQQLQAHALDLENLAVERTAALQASEAELRAIFSAMTDVILVLDGNGRYLKVAPTNTNLLYRPPDELVGKTLSQVFPQAEAVFFLEQIRKSLESGRDIRLEYSLAIEAAEKWFSATVAPMQADTVIWVARDITEHKQREREREALLTVASVLRTATTRKEMLPALLEQLKDLLDADGVAIAMLDFRTNETVIESGRGYAAETVGTLLPTNSITHQIMANGKPYLNNAVRNQPEFAFLKLKEVRAFAGAPLIGQGEPIGALWISRKTPISQEDLQLLVAVADMAATAIRRAMLLEQTQEQTRQLQHIMNTVPEGLLLLNAERRIVLANSVAQDYLAFLTEANVGDILTHLGERPLHQMLAPALSGTPWHELELLKTEQMFEITAHKAARDSLHPGWLLMLRDVTQERRRQQYLRTQERLATVGQLAAGIAHDFNNIMAVITLYSQMLLASPGLTEKEQQRLTTIHKQANRAADLIRQIMDFSRHSNIERHPMMLIPFMKEVVKLLNRSLLESIEIKFVEPLESDYVINADPTRLQQVIMNLAVNARDAMPRGGSLEITLDSMDYGEKQPAPLPDMTPGKWICTTFTDTGTGIPADGLPHIFEPFFTTKQVGQGTGLGLAQVHGIIKQHDGAITVDSRLGEGTTFTIYLPALIATTSKIRETGPLSFPRTNNRETVLVVDDNVETLMAVREALQILGYKVLTARKGQEALMIIDANQNAIDLILTDMVMPEMSGFDLCRTLQDRYPKLKVMIMSGYPRDKADDGLLGAEEITWLQKPISIQTLAQKVQQTFGGY